MPAGKGVLPVINTTMWFTSSALGISIKYLVSETAVRLVCTFYNKNLSFSIIPIMQSFYSIIFTLATITSSTELPESLTIYAI